MSERIYPVAACFQNLLKCELVVVQAALLCVALLVYGALGSPTPDDIGVVEFVVGGMLVVAVGMGGFAAAFKRADFRWIFAARVFTVFGICSGLGMAVISGNPVSLMIRDGVAFVFLILPVLFLHFIRNDRQQAPLLVLAGIVGVGALFSIRSVFDVPYLGQGDALYYLSNSPAVLFTALFCVGIAIQIFVTRYSVRSLPIVFMLCTVCALCVMPMIETQQRASVAAFVLGAMIFIGFAVWKYPKRGVVVGVIACVIGVFMWSFAGDVLNDLSRKTDLVGANMRAEEWKAVWGVVSQNPFTLFFGAGWGGTFSSPAVADINVNFTHGLLSSLLLKHGIIGLALGGAYVFAVLFVLLRHSFQVPVLVVAAGFPILIDVFFYASYKSLDFGVVMLVGLLLSRHKECYRFSMRES